MIIETSRELDAWTREALAASGAAAGLDDAAAAHAIQAISSVVWRHAHGQGLRLGDDWGWILDLYDAAAVREIVRASIDAQRETASRRRRRGF
jgi:hypothetical protein